MNEHLPPEAAEPSAVPGHAPAVPSAGKGPHPGATKGTHPSGVLCGFRAGASGLAGGIKTGAAGFVSESAVQSIGGRIKAHARAAVIETQGTRMGSRTRHRIRGPRRSRLRPESGQPPPEPTYDPNPATAIHDPQS